MNVNWEFISGLEGGQKLEGYVPTNRQTGNAIGRSGVTIATGVDIGQRSARELRRLPIPVTLANKLAFYALKIRGEAIEALRIRPLTITKGEANLLDRAIRIRHAADFEDRFDAVSTTKLSDLPGIIQTSLVSLAYNMGPNFGDKHDKLWGNITAHEWDLVADYLETHDWVTQGIKNRRKKEASLFRALDPQY